MTVELTWLTAALVLTALFWMPYMIDVMVVRGIPATVGYPDDPEPMHPWADRLKRAHANAVENLVVFGGLVLVAHVADVHSAATEGAAMAYFWCRLGHAVVFTAKLPWLRTVAFVGGWVCQMVLAWAILSAM